MMMHPWYNKNATLVRVETVIQTWTRVLKDENLKNLTENRIGKAGVQWALAQDKWAVAGSKQGKSTQ